MTPDAFKRWRKSQRLSQQKAGKALGVSRRTVANWESDKLSGGIPKAVELACAALALGIKDYEGPQG